MEYYIVMKMTFTHNNRNKSQMHCVRQKKPGKEECILLIYDYIC